MASLQLSGASSCANVSARSSAYVGLKLRSSSSFASGVCRERFQLLRIHAATTVSPKFTTLKPLGDRVLVKIHSTEEKTSAGILLPTAAQSKPQSGEVVAIGDGKVFGDKKVGSSVQEGKKVVYSKYAGTELEFNGANHLLLKEDDIMGFLETDDIKDLEPLNDRVLIEVAEADTKTAGGVLLTDTAKEKPVTGTIVSVGLGSYGEDGTQKPLELTKGDTVMYSKYAGSDFKSKDGKQLVVLKAADVLAVLP